MSNYALATHDLLTLHSLGRIFRVRDGEATDEHELLHAQVVSGDYFVTLATQLDQISEAIATTHPAEHMNLERAISDLIHLQSNYSITRNR